MPKIISARLLRRLLSYDPSTGELVWRERPVWMFLPHHKDGKRETRARIWNTRYAGKRALCSLDFNGYHTGTIFNRPIKAHRAIWTITTGAWPDGAIDHINGDAGDNRLENLRTASQSENMKNKAKTALTESGVFGVYWMPSRNKWRATIGVRGQMLHLGVFEADELDRAISARKEAEFKFGFHPNHGRAAQ